MGAERSRDRLKSFSTPALQREIALYPVTARLTSSLATFRRALLGEARKRGIDTRDDLHHVLSPKRVRSSNGEDFTEVSPEKESIHRYEIGMEEIPYALRHGPSVYTLCHPAPEGSIQFTGMCPVHFGVFKQDYLEGKPVTSRKDLLERMQHYAQNDGRVLRYL